MNVKLMSPQYSTYSETSDKGHSHNTKNLYIKDKFFWPKLQFFSILLVYFQPLRRGHLPITDINCWSQGVLYIEVPLYI